MEEPEEREHKHVEKETMDSPQEEFIADMPQPSVQKKAVDEEASDS